MRACVIFDTRYGNTEKVARALVSGLRESGIETNCVGVKDLSIGSLDQYDLICVGGPTQYRTASEGMQEFLASMTRANLSGKRAFAFDTRRESFFAGSAAKYIEGRLRRQGLIMVYQSESAIIVSYGPERKKEEFRDKEEWKEWRHKNEGLCEGEEKRFEKLGAMIGNSLAQSANAITGAELP
jgi:flavodoxin